MSVASPLPFRTFVANSGIPTAPRSFHAPALNDTESHHSPPRPFSLRKHVLDLRPTTPGHSGGGHTTKRQRVLKTSLDNSRNCEVRDYMNKKMLSLARKSREVYVAKMQYQRLRMQELEMLKDVMGDELEETEGFLSQTEQQIGQIHEDLSNSGVNSRSNAEQWALAARHLFPRRSPDGVLSRGERSTVHSEHGINTTSFSVASS